MRDTRDRRTSVSLTVDVIKEEHILTNFHCVEEDFRDQFSVAPVTIDTPTSADVNLLEPSLGLPKEMKTEPNIFTKFAAFGLSKRKSRLHEYLCSTNWNKPSGGQQMPWRRGVEKAYKELR